VKKKLFTGVATLGVIALGVAPLHAGTGSGATPNLSASYSVGDAQFDGSGCTPALITINYTKSGAEIDDISGRVRLESRYAGSSDSNANSTFIGYFEPQQGIATSEFTICSFAVEDGMTSMEVTGTIVSDVFTGTETSATLTPTTLNIIQNPTKLSKPKLVSKGSFVKYRVITGTAKATTLTKGVVGADGRIVLEARKSGSKKWVEVNSTSADSFGKWDFSYVSYRDVPRNSTIRISVKDCGWCTTDQVTVKAR
jgi:hypothetical protein